MNKRQEKAVAKAEKLLENQIAHVEKMIAAGAAEMGVRAAKRLVVAFEMKVAHLKAGKDEKSFDIFEAGRVAREKYPFVSSSEVR